MQAAEVPGQLLAAQAWRPAVALLGLVTDTGLADHCKHTQAAVSAAGSCPPFHLYKHGAPDTALCPGCIVPCCMPGLPLACLLAWLA